MTTSAESSEMKRPVRSLTVFDLMNGARIVGESVPGFETNCVINPVILTIEKGDSAENVKLNMNPVLFTKGSLYRVQPSAMVAHYQCFDKTLHDIYERVLGGGQGELPPAEEPK